MNVEGFEPWDAKAASYEAIGERIKATGANAVYLGGIVCNNGVKLIKDIGAVLGKGVTLVGSGRLDAVLGDSRQPARRRRACTSASPACRSRSWARRARRS